MPFIKSYTWKLLSERGAAAPGWEPIPVCCSHTAGMLACGDPRPPPAATRPWLLGCTRPVPTWLGEHCRAVWQGSHRPTAARLQDLGSGDVGSSSPSVPFCASSCSALPKAQVRALSLAIALPWAQHALGSCSCARAVASCCSVLRASRCRGVQRVTASFELLQPIRSMIHELKSL